MNAKIQEYITSKESEIIKNLEDLVAIPSVKDEPRGSALFGEEPKRALLKMKEICEGMGFKTTVYDNAVLCADYGNAPELGILAHLDVVPAESLNWNTNPFQLTEKDGILYGRGVIDDKGPAVAALWALNAIKELNIPLSKGVRLIFGTDEENGSEDLKIYKKYDKFPPKVFTPDGAFPVINIEKGMLRLKFSGNTGSNYIEFRGGNIPNVVPDKAKAIMRKISADKARAAIPEDSEAKFTITERGDNIFISCDGKAAHASTPEGGVNAVTALLSIMNKLADEPGLQGIGKLFPFGETDGATLGLKFSDDSGALTCVLSTLSILPSGECEGTADIRFPASMTLAQVKSKVEAAFGAHKLKYDILLEEEPHVVPAESEFIKTLLSVYEDVEGEKGGCVAIGGGTYVHDIEGGVAFGAERGGTDYHMHGDNEFITKEELLKDAVLFAHAIAEICK